MKDNFEAYIKRNRKELDHVEDLDVTEMWEDFQTKPKPRSLVFRMRFWTAAAVALLLISLTFLYQSAGPQSPDDMLHERLSTINPELAAEQVAMIKFIEQQDKLIQELGIDETQFPELFDELKYLDTLQEEALQDLKTLGDRSNLIKTLLKHYQRKARVLELMLYEFEKQENDTTYENERQI